jgi:hypothetical protein
MSTLSASKRLSVRKLTHNYTHVSSTAIRRQLPTQTPPQVPQAKIPPQSTAQCKDGVGNDTLASNCLVDPVQTKTVSVKEAAFRLRKSPDSVYAWLRRGRLLGWQPGGPGCQIQVIESSIDQALKHMPGRPLMMAEAV